MTFQLTGCMHDREVRLNGMRLDPEPSKKIRNHSPDNFSWGYGGSGPAQLALAVLNELFPQEYAQKWYQQFKWDVIANLPQEDFHAEITIIGNQSISHFQLKLL